MKFLVECIGIEIKTETEILVCNVCCNKRWQKRILFLFYHLYKCKNLSCCVLLIKRNVMHFRRINNQKILWFIIKSRLTTFWDWAAFRVFVWTDVAVRIIVVHISSSIISTEIVVWETTCHLWPYHAVTSVTI